MRIIRTDTDDLDSLPSWDKDMVYNGLDVCVTLEAYQALAHQLDPISNRTYNFSKSLQAPVLDMGFRGVLIDQERKDAVIEELYDTIETLSRNLERIVLDGIGLSHFNWNSSADLRALFYDELYLPHQRNKGRPTADRDAREKLSYYPIATQICKHINVIADLQDKLSVLRTQLDPDGRMRTNYNIAGTSTGRFSSSESVFGTGSNMQNITESLRSILISDPGMKFAKFDAKSGESFCVGAIEWNLFHDPTYLEVCETGDPHTAVARVMWSNLGWTGNLRDDKKLAEQPYYRHHSYRFMCKKLGHGSNYGGKPQTLAQEAQVEVELVKAFQPAYFSAFPSHQLWHEWVRDTIRQCGQLTSLCGRRRYFHSRRTDDKTIREALAYDPQSSLADIVNSALIKLWRLNLCPIVMQDHDAITFMYPEAQEDTLIPQLLKEIIVPVQLSHGRTLRIPYDCEVGWNKGHFDEDDPEKNPNGLRSWKGHDERKRERWSKSKSVGCGVGSKPSVNKPRPFTRLLSGASG